MVAESKNGRKIDLLLPDHELFSLILVKLDRKEKKLKAKSIKKSLSKICLIIKKLRRDHKNCDLEKFWCDHKSHRHIEKLLISLKSGLYLKKGQ